MSTQNITLLDGSRYEAMHSSISQNIFSYLRKIITVEDNKKKNEYNYLYKYIYKYRYLYYM